MEQWMVIIMSPSYVASVISRTILLCYDTQGLDADPFEDKSEADPFEWDKLLRATDQQKEGAWEARGTGGQEYVL